MKNVNLKNKIVLAFLIAGGNSTNTVPFKLAHWINIFVDIEISSKPADIQHTPATSRNQVLTMETCLRLLNANNGDEKLQNSPDN